MQFGPAAQETISCQFFSSLLEDQDLERSVKKEQGRWKQYLYTRPA